MSQSAFAAMVSDIKRNGLPDLATDHASGMRKLVAGARNAVVGSDSQYGDMIYRTRLDAMPGKPRVVLEHLNVQAYIQYAYGLGGSFANLVDSVHRARPSTLDVPWGVIIYADEVEPGQELAARHERKIYAVYVTIREFGPLTISNAEAWITVVTQPSHELHTVAGGLGTVIGTCIESMFLGEFSFTDVGVNLVRRDGSQIRIYLDLAMFLMDGAAHKELWNVKGDGGMFFCMLCPNLCTRASQVAEYAGTRQIISDFLPEDLDRCGTATDDSIRRTVRRLAAFAAVNPADLVRKREMVAGFNHNPHNLLLNPRLERIVKPVSQFCHDGMHLLLSNGVVNVMVVLLFEKARALGMNAWVAMYAFVQSYAWPHNVQSKVMRGLYDVFAPHRAERSRDKGSLSCQASELLSLIPVLRHFCIQHLLGIAGMQNAANAFLACLDVADTYFAIPFGEVTPEMLKLRVETFAALVFVADWNEYTIPKFHWLVHLWKHMRRFGYLPNCFPTERKNQTVKRSGGAVHNTRTYQHSILTDVTAAHAARMGSASTFDVHVGLIEPFPANQQMCGYLVPLFEFECAPDDVRTARTARYGVRGVCAKGDVVLLKHQQGCDIVAAEVWFHFDILGEPGSLVSVWELLEMHKDAGWALWRKIDNPTIVCLDDIVGVCIHSVYPSGRVVKTLLPYGA